VAEMVAPAIADRQLGNRRRCGSSAGFPGVVDASRGLERPDPARANGTLMARAFLLISSLAR
jgi:hypothetical protein